MTTSPANQQPPTIQNQAEGEIDLRQVAGALFRHWPFIAAGGAFGLIFSGLQLFNSKPVYQGEFKIVLGQENDQSGMAGLLSQNPSFAAFAGLSEKRSNSITTEIQIQQSLCTKTGVRCGQST